MRAADAKAWLASFVFPPVCAGCGRMARRGSELCGRCFATASATPSRPTAPPGIDAVACGPLVGEASRALVHGLKYDGHRRAASDLVGLATPSVPDGFCLDGCVLVPVPVHPHRRRERGYNQSALLARHWSRILSREVREDFLVRRTDTRTQTRLDADKRRDNLAGAFQVGKGFRKEVPVVLVDDVLTTGSTLSACASALLAAGCPGVRAICVLWAGEA
jgi:ComF family protein